MDKVKEAFGNFMNSIPKLDKQAIEKKKVIKQLLEQKPIDVLELKKHCVSNEFGCLCCY
jgi:hypothetical protein